MAYVLVISTPTTPFLPEFPNNTFHLNLFFFKDLLSLISTTCVFIYWMSFTRMWATYQQLYFRRKMTPLLLIKVSVMPSSTAI